ncbi:glutamate--cysteine ligase regulatory subunit isoform X2 [Homalodisca vitripennis]|uniref:glutamate--cysteine ligase regulatory subunit isoform X2 n=1 Tax=Homalodisca vitripennis TaxID=197043 RepID=UPI001EEC7AD1|nr:glutamate--cysteine ligase regulatory subunit isoform X2 [Homalodisca vitripennis]
MVNIPENINKICVHTGNILNLNEVKKNAGQNSSEELVESLKIALKGWSPPAENNGTCLEVRSNDETIKVSGVERSELRTSAKVFITSDKKEALQEAIDKLFASLEADNIDSVVMAYTGTSHEANNRLSEIQHLWEVLEANVQSGKLSRIGISDVDTDLFITLYNSAKTKPSIVQINLASCCVVPPALQEFCKQNDIQLLTHNDPLELLPNQALQTILQQESQLSRVDWAVRFQIHVKCRGVLATKGYIICISLHEC